MPSGSCPDVVRSGRGAYPEGNADGPDRRRLDAAHGDARRGGTGGDRRRRGGRPPRRAGALPAGDGAAGTPAAVAPRCPTSRQGELDTPSTRSRPRPPAPGVVTIVGAERPTPAGREIVAIVLDADGSRLGEQVKTQIDPEEDSLYVAGSGRRTFTAGGVTFAIAICHEAFRYPEIVRGAVLDGAQVVFVPHYVTTTDGSLPVAVWRPEPVQREGAAVPGAREHGLRRTGEHRRSRSGVGELHHRAGRLARRAGALRPGRRGDRRHRPLARRRPPRAALGARAQPPDRSRTSAPRPRQAEGGTRRVTGATRRRSGPVTSTGSPSRAIGIASARGSTISSTARGQLAPATREEALG